MEFFIDDQEIEDQFQNIFKKIQILRNGETHQEMKNLGLTYQKSVGAGIVNLREIAADYTPNHLLAHKLWAKGFRETKILATLLEESNLVNTQQLDRWLKEMDFNELLEQASMNLFVNLSDVEDLGKDWIQSKNRKKELCAIMLSGRLAMRKDNQYDSYLEQFVDILPQNIEDSYYRNQLARCLGKIVRRNNKLAEKISKLVLHLKSKDKNWLEIWENLQYELELRG
ncbi:DNA alkylation repair protein [Ancylomarina longa]|uniref:DNA alkylation repair protein n=1 Tax=Ancylomarina longa TaxID=2487017 RepID=A0A434AXS7_9BACT|nr:DNA alkylation repair protein [Ancylomarina longa]RUT79356.1 hypothetical protein DLK05_03805 [Ancylomarina longa]